MARGAEARRLDAEATGATMAVTPEHAARSRNHPRPSASNLVACAAFNLMRPPLGPCETSGRRSHPEALGRGIRPCPTTHLPERQPEMTKSSHTLPAGHAMVCSGTRERAIARNVVSTWSDVESQNMADGQLARAVPGSHRTSPGDPARALRARWTVRARTSARTRAPGKGKGLRGLTEH